MDNGAERHPNLNRINFLVHDLLDRAAGHERYTHSQKTTAWKRTRWRASRTVNVDVDREVGSDWGAGLAWDIIHFGCHVWISYRMLWV